MKLFHISHTDLDGYTCQLITKQIFKNPSYYNANYGLEVKLSIDKVFNEIELLDKKEEIFILITDVNLTIGEAKDLEKKYNEFTSNGYKIKLQLLDHHASGQKSADKYKEWYFLDVKRSATKIVYDYMIENYGEFDENISSWLKPLVDSVNAVDIWLDHEVDNFEFGKVLLTMVARAREVNEMLFADLNRDYRQFLIMKACEYLFEENRHISLDSKIHSLKKEFLRGEGEDNTLDNLSALYLVRCLEDKKDDLIVTYKGHKGLLTYSLGSISIPANTFLKANPDFDFFVDIGRKGFASFRADGNVDVAQMAVKMCDGGGHVNASGGKFTDFKETIHYDEVKEYFQNKLNKL